MKRKFESYVMFLGSNFLEDVVILFCWKLKRNRFNYTSIAVDVSVDNRNDRMLEFSIIHNKLVRCLVTLN